MHRVLTQFNVWCASKKAQILLYKAKIHLFISIIIGEHHMPGENHDLFVLIYDRNK